MANLGRRVAVKDPERRSDWKPVLRIQKRVVTKTLAKLLGSSGFSSAALSR